MKDVPSDLSLSHDDIYKIFVEHSVDGLIVIDSEGIVRFANAAAKAMFAEKTNELVGSWLGVPAIQDPVELVVPGGGKIRYVELVAAEIGWEGKSASLASLRDVTDRKNAEDAVTVNEHRFRSLIENATDLVCVIDARGRILFISPSLQQLGGYTPDEVTGKNIFEFTHPEDLPAARTALSEVIQLTRDPHMAELRFRHKNGSFVLLEPIARNLLDDSAVSGIVINARDVTEQRRSEELVRASEIRYRTLFANMLEGYARCEMIVKDNAPLDCIYLEVNPAFETLTALTDVIGKKLSDVIPGIRESNPEVLQAYARAAAGGQPERIETYISALDRWLQIIVYGAQENSFIAVFDNITERKRTEIALRESEAEFHNLAEAMPQIVWITRPDGGNIYFNHQWMDYTGMTLEESLGEGWNKPFHPDDQQRAWDAWQRATAQIGIYSIESRLRRADGIYRWWLVRGVPLKDAAGNILRWFGTCTDIHDLKTAELEISRTNRELRESEHRFSDMLRNVKLVSVMRDREERITFCNEYLLHLTGWQVEEVIGRNWIELFLPPEIAKETKGLFEALLLNRADTRHHESEILTRSGERRLIRWNNSVLRSGAGEVIGAASIGEDITERKRAEVDLAANEALLKEFIRHTPAAIAMLDTQMRYIQTSERWMQDYNLAGQNIIGKSHYAIFPEIGQRWKDIHQRVLAGAIEHCDEDPFLRADGSTDWLQWEARPWYQSKDKIGGIIFFTQVITERKKAEARIAQLNRVLLVLSSINALIVRANDHGELFRGACNIVVDAGKFRMALLVIVDPVTMLPVSITSAGKNEELFAEIKNVLSSSEGMRTTLVGRVIREHKAVIANDTQNDPRLVFAKLYTEAGVKSMMVLPLIVAGKASGVFALYANEIDFFQAEEMKLLTDLASDIAFAIDHINKQDQINYLAYYDALTGLANRTLFLERVARHMRRADSGGYKLAIGLVDLERFKSVNDSLGRPAGDTLLKQVAEWLSHKAGDAKLLARIDADHFAFVMPEIKAEGNLTGLFDKVAQTFLAHSFRAHNTELRVACKIGIAIFPDDGTDAETVYRNAEAALKTAKKSGDRYLFHTNAMTAAVATKLTLENQLRRALDNEEFVLHYQPKVNLASGKITSAEALIRWNDPRTGLVPPGQFIPVLEETGLIHDVGRWALHQAIADYLRWRKAGLPAVRLAVNVSPLQLHNRGFVDEVRQVIGIDAHAAEGLELEITESLIMEDVKSNIASLGVIRDLGVSIAIDDFGTGFSSLSYLARLPVHTLKIDRAFVIDMTVGAEGLALVSTIISLAHALKLKVVAEGVETEEQSRLLRLLACDEMQGFLFSKPVPAEMFESRFLVPPSAAG